MPKDIAITREHKRMRDRVISFFSSQKGCKLVMRKDDEVALANRIVRLVVTGRKVRRRDRTLVRRVVSQMISSKEIVKEDKTYRLAPDLRKGGVTNGRSSQQYANSRTRAMAS